MKLDKAMLCLNCEEVHDENTCPSCGSFFMFPIAKWLNRKPEPVAPEIVEINELERLYRLERKWD